MRHLTAFLLGLVLGACLLSGWQAWWAWPAVAERSWPPDPPLVVPASTPAPCSPLPAASEVPVLPPTTLEAPPEAAPSGAAVEPLPTPTAVPEFHPVPAPSHQAAAPLGPPLTARAHATQIEPPETILTPLTDLSDIERLRARRLLVPVRGVAVRSLHDDFAQMRGTLVHEAIDILAPRGTEVLAVDDGPVKRLFFSVRGGITVYQFDPSSTYCYYYAHLDRYAHGLKEGQVLRQGEVIGYVGTTGNAPPGTPHLHFQLIKLGPAKKWWEGTSINPYPLWAFRP